MCVSFVFVAHSRFFALVTVVLQYHRFFAPLQMNFIFYSSSGILPPLHCILSAVEEEKRPKRPGHFQDGEILFSAAGQQQCN